MKNEAVWNAVVQPECILLFGAPGPDTVPVHAALCKSLLHGAEMHWFFAHPSQHDVNFNASHSPKTMRSQLSTVQYSIIQ